jgi:hypothetical protein
MLWLRDVAVAVERAPDGRSARVFVRENDALASGEQPPVVGADVVVEGHRAGEAPLVLARGETGPEGVFGFATPSDLASEQIALVVRAKGRNARHVRLDGRRLVLDLRKALYGVPSETT